MAVPYQNKTITTINVHGFSASQGVNPSTPTASNLTLQECDKLFAEWIQINHPDFAFGSVKPWCFKGDGQILADIINQVIELRGALDNKQHRDLNELIYLYNSHGVAVPKPICDALLKHDNHDNFLRLPLASAANPSTSSVRLNGLRDRLSTEGYVLKTTIQA